MAKKLNKKGTQSAKAAKTAKKATAKGSKPASKTAKAVAKEAVKAAKTTAKPAKAPAKAAKPVKPVKATAAVKSSPKAKAKKAIERPKILEWQNDQEDDARIPADAPEKYSKLMAKWQGLFNKAKNIKTEPYDMRRTYERQTAIDHKILGWGFILDNKNDRLEVLFRDGIKYLISNYK